MRLFHFECHFDDRDMRNLQSTRLKLRRLVALVSESTICDINVISMCFSAWDTTSRCSKTFFPCNGCLSGEMIQLDNAYFNRAAQDLIYTVILPLLLLLIHTACVIPLPTFLVALVFFNRVKLFKFRWGMTCQGCIVPCLNSRKPENM